MGVAWLFQSFLVAGMILHIGAELSLTVISTLGATDIDGLNVQVDFECNSEVTLVCRITPYVDSAVWQVNGTSYAFCIFQNCLYNEPFPENHNFSMDLTSEVFSLTVNPVPSSANRSIYNCNNGIIARSVEAILKVYPNNGTLIMDTSAENQITVTTGCVYPNGKDDLTFEWYQTKNNVTLTSEALILKENGRPVTFGCTETSSCGGEETAHFNNTVIFDVFDNGDDYYIWVAVKHKDAPDRPPAIHCSDRKYKVKENVQDNDSSSRCSHSYCLTFLIIGIITAAFCLVIIVVLLVCCFKNSKIGPYLLTSSVYPGTISGNSDAVKSEWIETMMNIQQSNSSEGVHTDPGRKGARGEESGETEEGGNAPVVKSRNIKQLLGLNSTKKVSKSKFRKANEMNDNDLYKNLEFSKNNEEVKHGSSENNDVPKNSVSKTAKNQESSSNTGSALPETKRSKTEEDINKKPKQNKTIGADEHTGMKESVITPHQNVVKEKESENKTVSSKDDYKYSSSPNTGSALHESKKSTTEEDKNKQRKQNKTIGADEHTGLKENDITPYQNVVKENESENKPVSSKDNVKYASSPNTGSALPETKESKMKEDKNKKRKQHKTIGADEHIGIKEGDITPHQEKVNENESENIPVSSKDNFKSSSSSNNVGGLSETKNSETEEDKNKKPKQNKTIGADEHTWMKESVITPHQNVVKEKESENKTVSSKDDYKYSSSPNTGSALHESKKSTTEEDKNKQRKQNKTIGADEHTGLKENDITPYQNVVKENESENKPVSSKDNVKYASSPNTGSALPETKESKMEEDKNKKRKQHKTIGADEHIGMKESVITPHQNVVKEKESENKTVSSKDDYKYSSSPNTGSALHESKKSTTEEDKNKQRKQNKTIGADEHTGLKENDITPYQNVVKENESENKPVSSKDNVKYASSPNTGSALPETKESKMKEDKNKKRKQHKTIGADEHIGMKEGDITPNQEKVNENESENIPVSSKDNFKSSSSSNNVGGLSETKNSETEEDKNKKPKQNKTIGAEEPTGSDANNRNLAANFTDQHDVTPPVADDSTQL